MQGNLVPTRKVDLTPTSKKDLTYAVSQLSKAIRRLYRHSRFLDLDADSNRILCTITRKLYVEEITNKKNATTISIYGLQGAGKSTLVAAMYGIPLDVLEQNAGRGEKMPIRIVESNKATGIQAWVYQLADPVGPKQGKDGTEKKGEEGIEGEVKEGIKRTELNIADFKLHSIKPKENDLMLELVVPAKYLLDGSTMLLLPGFEDRHQEKEWDQLARYASEASSASILVVDPAQYARELSRDLLDRAKESVTRGRAVIILAKADQDPHHNANYRQKILEDLQLEPDHLPRIICSSVKKDICSEWLEQIKTVLNNFGGDRNRAKNARLELLENTVQKDLKAYLDIFKRIRAKHTFDATKKELRIEDYLQPFRESRNRVREMYERKLREQLVEHAEHARLKIAADLKNNDLSSILNKLNKFFMGPAIDHILKFEERVKGCWQASYGGLTLMDRHSNVLGEVVADRLRIPKKSKEPGTNLVLYADSDTSNPAFSETTAEMIYGLSRRDSCITEEGAKNGTMEAMKALPPLVLEYARVQGCGVMPEVNANGVLDQKQYQKLTETLHKASHAQKTAFAMLGGLLTLDGAVDGEINSLPNLLKALGLVGGGAGAVAQAGGAAAAGGGSASTAVGTTAAGGGAAAVGGGVAIASAALFGAVLSVVVTRSIRSRDREEYDAAKTICQSLKDQVVDTCLLKYDEAMDAMEKRITENLVESLNVLGNAGRLLLADIALAQVEEQRICVLECIADEQMV